MSRIDKSISIKFLPWLIPVGASLFVLFLINTFLFKLIYIPSFDMNPTYQKGDLVLVKKKNTISDNQVIVFNFFSDDSLDRKPILFTQRCIAKPGDTLLIESGFVYVNSISERNTNRFYYNYHFKLASKIDSSFLIKYNLKEGGQISNELDYSYSMKESTADSLRKDSLVISVYKNIERGNFRDEEIYTDDTLHKWNKHNFGPLYIPKKGDTLRIDTSNVFFYKRLIEMENKSKIVIKNDSIFLNENYLNNVTIKENYYFVMGDNRDNAIDSRYIGLIPQKNIIGIIAKKLHSSNKQ